MRDKILFIILLLVLPIIVFAEDVSIKSIELIEKSKYAEEVDEASYEGLKLSFNLRFNDVDDYALYKVLLVNNSDDDYKVSTSSSTESQYIKYEYDTDNTNDVLKAKSEVLLYIKAIYAKEVPSNLLENNKYKEDKHLNVTLVTASKEEVETTKNKEEILSNSRNINPNTGNTVIKIGNVEINLYFIGIILSSTIIVIYLFKNKRVRKYTNYILILGILIIPVSILAIKELTIEIESVVEIEKVELSRFTLINDDNNIPVPKVYDFIEGMSLEEWINSKYNVDNIKLTYYDDNNLCYEGYVISDGDLYIFSDETIDSSVVYLAYYEDCLFHFTIKSVENNNEVVKDFVAKYDMTWEEWVNSEYNVDNYELLPSIDAGTCKSGKYIGYYREEGSIIESIYVDNEEIIINSEYVILDFDCDEDMSIYVYNSNDVKIYHAQYGMTWNEWLNSTYNVDNISFAEPYEDESGCKIVLIASSSSSSFGVYYNDIIYPQFSYSLEMGTCVH